MPKTWLPQIETSHANHLVWLEGHGDSTTTFGGHLVFTDGALRQLQWWKEATRAGWGVAQITEDGHLQYACYGPLPGPTQTVPRAELHACCMALRMSVGPLTIHTDHKPIVDGLLRAKDWATDGSRVNADLWRELWQLLEDKGGLEDDLQIKWVKAHQTIQST